MSRTTRQTESFSGQLAFISENGDLFERNMRHVRKDMSEPTMIWSNNSSKNMMKLQTVQIPRRKPSKA